MTKFRKLLQGSAFTLVALSCATLGSASAQTPATAKAPGIDKPSMSSEQAAQLFSFVDQAQQQRQSLELRMKPIVEQMAQLHLETVFQPEVITSKARIENARMKLTQFKALLAQRQQLIAESIQRVQPLLEILKQNGDAEHNEKLALSLNLVQQMTDIQYELARVSEAFLQFGEDNRGEFALVSGQMLFQTQDQVDTYIGFGRKLLELGAREEAVVQQLQAQKKLGETALAKYQTWKESKKGLPSKLIGTWELTPESGCKESYEFRANGTFESRSGSEILTGNFVASILNPTARADLALTRNQKQSNGLADCMGAVLEKSNSSDQRFILFGPAKDEYLVCDSEEASYCIGPLVKVETEDKLPR